MKPRYLHIPTGRHYAVALEWPDKVELEGIDRRRVMKTREQLADKNVWQRLP